MVELLGQVGVVRSQRPGVEMKVTDEDVGLGYEDRNSSPFPWEDLPLPSYLAIIGEYFSTSKLCLEVSLEKPLALI